MVKVNTSKISISEFTIKYGLTQCEMIPTCYIKADENKIYNIITVQNVRQADGHYEEEVLTVCKDSDSFVKMVKDEDVVKE